MNERNLKQGVPATGWEGEKKKKEEEIKKKKEEEKKERVKHDDVAINGWSE